MSKAWKFEDNLNTDEIIPGRFNITIDPLELAKNVFCEIKPEYSKNAAPGDVIIGGQNFGCGSSREHAPQALRKFGFNAVIAESFAEIFFGNSTTLAMPCVIASAADVATLRAAIEADPATIVTIDLSHLKVRTSGGLDIPVTMPESAREALVSGRWDPIQELLNHEAAIDAKARELHYV